MSLAKRVRLYDGILQLALKLELCSHGQWQRAWMRVPHEAERMAHEGWWASAKPKGADSA